MAAPRSYTLNITIGSLQGVKVSNNYIQAVWEALKCPQQTELQQVFPSSESAGSKSSDDFFGTATWNETFSINDIVVESDDVECYLEIAFWQYADPVGDPVAIGFKRVDISDFHKNLDKVLEFTVDIDQQDEPAKACITLSTVAQEEAASSSFPEDASQSSPAAPVALPEATGGESEQAQLLAAAEQKRLAEEALRQQEAAQAGLLRQQEQLLRRREEEQRLREEEDRRRQAEAQAQEEAQAQAQAAAAAMALEQQAAAAQVLATAAAATPPVVEASSSDTVVLLSGPQKAALYRTLLTRFCNLPLPEEAVAPLSRAFGVEEGATPLTAIVAGLLHEGEEQAELTVQEELQGVLQDHILASYLASLAHGRELLRAVEGAVRAAARQLLQLPATLPVVCAPDADEARAYVLEVAQRRVRTAGQGGRPVFYAPAGREPPFALPEGALLRSVPLEGEGGDRLDEPSLAAMVAEDAHAGNAPCMVTATVGLSGPAMCDPLGPLAALCKSTGMLLHVEGPGLFLLMTDCAEARQVAGLTRNPDLALALTVPTRQLLAFQGCSAPGALAFLQLPEGVSSAPAPALPPPAALRLYCLLRSTGLAALRLPAQRRVTEVAYLVEALTRCGCVELLTAPSNLLHVRFHFVAAADTPDVLKTNELNSMLHRMFLSGLEPPQALNALSLQSHATGVQCFEHDLLGHAMEQPLTDALCSLLQRCRQTLQSIIQFSHPVQEAVQQIETLILVPDISKTPLALACFRLIPPFYRTFERLTDSHIRDLNSINTKLIGLLEQEDPAFQGMVLNGQTFVVVASDPNLTLVFTEEYVARLMGALKATVTKLECDDEILSKIQAEITKRGIEVAEKQLQQSKLLEEQQESVLRLLPVVGSLANWWAPPGKPHSPESFSFDLRTSTLTKQVARMASGPAPS